MFKTGVSIWTIYLLQRGKIAQSDPCRALFRAHGSVLRCDEPQCFRSLAYTELEINPLAFQ